MRYFIFVLSGLSLLVTGCATTAPQRTYQPVETPGTQNVIEKSAKEKPDWITHPFTEKKGIMYFSGGVREVADYSLGLEQAEAEALKGLVKSIQLKARSEFTENIRGSNLDKNELEKFISDGIAIVADNVEVSGVFPKETYYEKIEEATVSGKRYLYNCYSLLQLSDRDYKIARNKALEDLSKKARNENNKKAEQTAIDLLKRLSEE